MSTTEQSASLVAQLLSRVEACLSGPPSETAVAECERILSGDLARDLPLSLRARTKNLLAAGLAAQGRYPRAQWLYRQVSAELVAAGDIEGSQQAALKAASCYMRVGAYRRALVLLRRVDSPPTSLSPRTRADLLFLTGSLLARTGSLEQARARLTKARSLFRREGDEISETGALGNLALIDRRTGNWAAATSAYREVIGAWGKLGDYQKIARSYLNLGILETAQGSWDSAEATLRRALGMSEAVGNRSRICKVKLALARLLCYQERTHLSRQLVREALRTARREGFRREQAIAYEILGDVAMAEGQLSGAERCYEAGLRLGEQISPSSDHDFQISRRLAECYLRRGNLKSAERMASRARSVALRVGDRLEATILLRVEGELRAARGSWPEAAEAFSTSVQSLRAIGARWELARALLAWGKAALKNGDRDPSAEDHVLEAADLFGALGLDKRREEAMNLLARLREVEEASPQGSPSLRALIGRSPGLLRVAEEARRVATSTIPVLIGGETGTGKDLLARIIHETSSRRTGPFVAINCATFPEGDLLYSELFGAARGSFTGCTRDIGGALEAADGGTLFLDEVSDLGERAQASLLRFLETGEFKRLGENRMRRVNVRLVSATHEDLGGRVSEGRFREDLYYRVARITLRLPPLRKRGADVSLLIDHFLGCANRREGKRVRLAAETRKLLEAHTWPGNVRQLEGEISALVALADDGKELVPEVLSSEILRGGNGNGTRWDATSFERHLQDTETEAIRQIMSDCGWVKARAARKLGMSRNGLAARLTRLGVSRPPRPTHLASTSLRTSVRPGASRRAK